MLRSIIFYLTLTAALFAQGVFAHNDVTSQNGVTAIGLTESIAVSWTNTCSICSWQLSTKYNNDPWVIQKVLPKGVTQYTIEGNSPGQENPVLRPGQEYLVKMDAKRGTRWVTRAVLRSTTGKKNPEYEDGTILKQILFFGRHGIRAAAFPDDWLSEYTHDDYPAFKVHWGYLTSNGQEAAKLLGVYFRDYLLREGLLTGDTTTDIQHSYFRANSIQRSNITAAKFGEGLILAPSYTTIPVHSYPLGNPDDLYDPSTPDPVFDPIAKSLEMVPKVNLHIDPARAVWEAKKKYGSGAKLASAYSSELSLISKVLYPGTVPTGVPPAQGSIDPTNQISSPFTLTAFPPNKIERTGGIVDLGGLDATNIAIDPFLMQYTDDFADSDLAWGRLPVTTVKSLSRMSRLITLQIDIEMRLPYVSQLQSSNAASHVLRTMSQARYGSSGSSGIFGDGNSEIKVIISSDYYVAGLAGLLDLHWTLKGSGYKPDYCCSPDGTIVFELRKYKISKAYVVRAFYYAQTYDQLRNLTPLSLEEPQSPAKEQLKFGNSVEISFDDFNRLVSQKIDWDYVRPFSQVPPPDVLADVPLE